MGLDEPFKICDMCGHQWNTLEEFATDEQLQVDGYISDFGRPEDGLIVLMHKCLNCRSLMCVEAGCFIDWRTEPIIADLRIMNGACPGYCLDSSNLEPCTQECSMRWVRDVLQYLQAHKIPEQLMTKARAKMDM